MNIPDYEKAMKAYADRQIAAYEEGKARPDPACLSRQDRLFLKFGRWEASPNGGSPILHVYSRLRFGLLYKALYLLAIAAFLVSLFNASAKNPTINFSLASFSLLLIGSLMLHTVEFQMGRWIEKRSLDADFWQRCMRAHEFSNGIVQTEAKTPSSNRSLAMVEQYKIVLEHLYRYCDYSEFPMEKNIVKKQAHTYFNFHDSLIFLKEEDIKGWLNGKTNGVDVDNEFRKIRASTFNQVQRLFLTYLSDEGLPAMLWFKLHLDANVMAKTAMVEVAKSLIEGFGAGIDCVSDSSSVLTKEALINRLVGKGLDANIVLEHQRNQEEKLLNQIRKGALEIQAVQGDGSKPSSPPPQRHV